jgi:hypothetical protein
MVLGLTGRSYSTLTLNSKTDAEDVRDIESSILRSIHYAKFNEVIDKSRRIVATKGICCESPRR